MVDGPQDLPGRPSALLLRPDRPPGKPLAFGFDPGHAGVRPDPPRVHEGRGRKINKMKTFYNALTMEEQEQCIAAYMDIISEADKTALRSKLKFCPALSKAVAAFLFGFECPLCGGKLHPDSGPLKTFFKCDKCGANGNLYNFQAYASGRDTAYTQDFLAVDAVSAFCDIGGLGPYGEWFGSNCYDWPEWFAEWEKINASKLKDKSNYVFLRYSLNSFLKNKRMQLNGLTDAFKKVTRQQIDEIQKGDTP